MPRLRGKGNQMTDTKDIYVFMDNLAHDPALRAHFANDLSYWWANIMYTRFFEPTGDKSTIIYNPISKSFGVIVNGLALNAHGTIKPEEIDDYMGWEYYYTNYPEQANYVLRDKVYLIPSKDWEEFCHKYGEPLEKE